MHIRCGQSPPHRGPEPILIWSECILNTTGILFGAFTFLAIGLGFLWVIKLEYHVGARAAWAVAALGAALVLLSLFVPSFAPSAILGVLGGTLIWGATELPAQEERVARGLFPANPR